MRPIENKKPTNRPTDRLPRPLENGHRPPKWPKIQNCRRKLKIGTETNFGAGISNLTMKKSENQPFDHAHAPPHQNRKVTQSSWKLAQRLILTRGIQIWQWKNLKPNRWPRPCPTPPKSKTHPIKLKIDMETNFDTGNSNLTIKKSETTPLTTPTPHPSKNKKWCNQAENWHRD